MAKFGINDILNAKTKAAGQRETGQPCRKIRYCTAFVYCSSAFEIQGT